MTATNIGYYCRTPYGLYPYASPLALDKLGLESYQIGKYIDRLGLQVTHARYNTGLFRVLWRPASDGKEYQNFTSSTNASVDKSVINLKNDIVEKYWQTAIDVPGGYPSAKLNQWFQFDVGAGLTSLIDTLALIGTNLTTSAIVKVKGYGSGSSSAPSNWNTVPNLITVPMPIDPLEKNVIYIAPTQPTQAFRHYRVTISDSTNTDGYIRIGRFLAGSSLIFTTENCLDSVTYKKENYKDEFAINGYTSIANNRALKKSMSVTFKDLNRLQYANYRRLMEYIADCRDTLKALVIIDPNEPYQFGVFAKLSEMPEETHNYVSNDTSSVSLTLNYNEAR